MDSETRRAARKRATIAFIAAGVLLVANVIALAVIRDDHDDRGPMGGDDQRMGQQWRDGPMGQGNGDMQGNMPGGNRQMGPGQMGPGQMGPGQGQNGYRMPGYGNGSDDGSRNNNDNDNNDRRQNQPSSTTTSTSTTTTVVGG